MTIFERKKLERDKYRKLRNEISLNQKENVAKNHDGKAAPYGSGYKEMDEAKIQVQGIGMYDDKTLKKKIIQLASELQKNAKKGNWNKASENGISPCIALLVIFFIRSKIFFLSFLFSRAKSARTSIVSSLINVLSKSIIKLILLSIQ